MNETGTAIFDKVSTGIEGLDFILEGGLPTNRLYLLQGNPGTGKTTMGLQFLLDGEAKGETGFYITLAAILIDQSKPAHQNIEEIQSDKNTDLSSGLHILLVEDDTDSREMLTILFEQSDMKVTAVNSAAEAVESLKSFKPDILISDIGLPKEDGYELIKKVRRLSPEQGGLIPAIALTGYVSVQDRRYALEAGYQEHLSKPVDVDRLLDMVKQLVN